MAYEYGQEQPNAPVHIGKQSYSYDKNGNQTGWTHDVSGQRRQILWDVENRIRTIYDNGAAFHYTYDAAGTRVIKGRSSGQAAYVNNEHKGGSGNMGNYTVYVNPYIVLKSGGYTKHYYIEGQRIVSKLGGGMADAGKSPKAGSDKVNYSDKQEQSREGIVRNLKFLGHDGALLTAGNSGKTPPGQIIGEGEGGGNGNGGGNGGGKDSEKFQYFYHPDHLGSSSYITDASGEVYQHLEYFAFGETFVEEHSNMHRTPYLFNSKELDDETGLYYYGARYYDAQTSVWLAVEMLMEKYPSTSPYAFSANNPVYFVDPDGREPVPSVYALNPWFKLKPTQWFSTAGVYDSKTFNSAALYSTRNQRTDAYQSVYQRNSYYGWVQGQANAKGYNSKWFGAAQMVTGLNAVGGTELPNLWVITDNTEAFLKGGNEFLFSHNMKNAKDFLADGKLSGVFTDANGNKQSFNGLSGMALDNKMVEFEQSKVQEYINSYKGNDLNSIIENINGLMQNPLGPGDVKDVMKEHFDGGKTFNFKSYDDRVKLGQELIKKAHNE